MPVLMCMLAVCVADSTAVFAAHANLVPKAEAIQALLCMLAVSLLQHEHLAPSPTS